MQTDLPLWGPRALLACALGLLIACGASALIVWHGSGPAAPAPRVAPAPAPIRARSQTPTGSGRTNPLTPVIATPAGSTLDDPVGVALHRLAECSGDVTVPVEIGEAALVELLASGRQFNACESAFIRSATRPGPAMDTRSSQELTSILAAFGDEPGQFCQALQIAPALCAGILARAMASWRPTAVQFDAALALVLGELTIAEAAPAILDFYTRVGREHDAGREIPAYNDYMTLGTQRLSEHADASWVEPLRTHLATARDLHAINIATVTLQSLARHNNCLEARVALIGFLDSARAEFWADASEGDVAEGVDRWRRYQLALLAVSNVAPSTALAQEWLTLTTHDERMVRRKALSGLVALAMSSDRSGKERVALVVVEHSMHYGPGSVVAYWEEWSRNDPECGSVLASLLDQVQEPAAREVIEQAQRGSRER